MKKGKGFVWGQIPFIANIGYREPELVTKDVDENGKYLTKGFDQFNVEVTTAEELTPEAQEEILNEEY